MILLAVCILILIPTVLAFRFRHEVKALRKENQALVEEVANRSVPETPPEPAVFEPVGETPSIEPPAEQPVEEPEAPADAEITADAPVYQTLYEDFYAPEPFHATERIPNTVYLTFDDGPSARTDDILKVLAEKNVKATFFVIGQSDEANLERMRRIVEAGHTIGMHSYSHDYSSVYSSVEGFLDEFYRIFCQIRDTTGVTPTVFRCPGGSINGYDGGIYQDILSEMIRRGFVPFDWNVSSEDAASNWTLSAQTLVDNVVRYSSGKVRSFVLFHDSESKVTSAQAVGPAIDRLREMGYSFAAITPDTMPVLYSYPQ